MSSNSQAPELPGAENARNTESIMPLGQFAERVLKTFHEIENNEEAMEIFRGNFAPDILVQINKDARNFDSYMEFVAVSRDVFHFVDVKIQNTIIVPSDAEGRGGTVSLTAEVSAKRKSDGVEIIMHLNEIYEITWFQFDGQLGKRLITKLFGVIDSPLSMSTS